MLHYLIKRLLLIVPTLFGVLLLSFIVMQFVPGGPVEQYLMEAKAASVAGIKGAGQGAEGGSVYQGNRGVDPQRLEEIKALYGFDRPAPERFWKMLKQFARFDLGTSFFHHQAVWDLMKEASAQIKTRKLLEHFPKALGRWTVKAIERFDFF